MKYPKYRFVILSIFSLIQIQNAAGWICFASIVDKILYAYPESSIMKINFLSWTFMLMYVPVNPVATWFLEKYGLRKSAILGVGIELMGFWLRTLINRNFNWVMLGQFLISVGQPFLYNMPVKISAEWFPLEERIISTSVGYNFSNIGNLWGFYLPLLFVSSKQEIDKIKS